MKKLLNKVHGYLNRVVESIYEAMKDEHRPGGRNDYWYFGD